MWGKFQPILLDSDGSWRMPLQYLWMEHRRTDGRVTVTDAADALAIGLLQLAMVAQERRHQHRNDNAHG